jgi:hypothetical protein
MNLIQSFLKKNPKENIILVALFILYAVVDVKTPYSIAKYIDTIWGHLIVIGLYAYMALKVHPIIAVLGIYVIYLLFKRSSISTGTAAMINYLPTEKNRMSEMVKLNQLTPFNQFPVTLEEEVVQQMAPLQQGGLLGPKTYVSVADDTHDAASINYNGVV